MNGESDEYDAIVVGAGPGGSTAAIVLAQNKLRTLLLDRESFPRDKACGDAVSAPAFRLLKELNVADFTESMAFEIKHVFIQGPRGGILTLPLMHQPDANASIISRYVFDNMILDRAIANGAKFCCANVTAPIIENGYVVGVNAKVGNQTVEYRSNVVIAADGATSVLARTLSKNKRPEHTSAVALRGYVETDIELEPTIDLVFLDEVQPGYAWFFPMGKRLANIGVGVRSDVYKQQERSLSDLLELYSNQPEVRRRIGRHDITHIKSWQVPLCLVRQKRVFDGAVLIGDAGGFVDPLTGAGIYSAIVTGKRAAEACIEAIRQNDVSTRGLASFDKLWQKDLGQDLQRSAFLYRLFSMMPNLIDMTLALSKSVPALRTAIFGKV
jgi:menaquinone-9 beta-reductase